MNQLLRKAIVESREFYLSTKSVWKRYQEMGQYPEGNIREEILDSWMSSKNLGVNPFQNRINEIITQHDLTERIERNEQLLSFASPQIASLADLLNDSKTMLSITDNNGTILHSSGEKKTLKKAEALNIFDGGTWSEKSAGTNAVGVSLKTKKSAQVLFSEHFCEKNHEWYCAATPILAPFTNELLGVVNIAGSTDRVNEHKVELVIAEAKNLAHSIVRPLFDHVLRNNLFLTAAMEGVEDAVFVVDSGKVIVEKNEAARSHHSLQGIQTIPNLTGLEALVDRVLQSGKKIMKEEVCDDKRKRKFVCSIYPVTFQEKHLGAVIFLKESFMHIQTKMEAQIPRRSVNRQTTRYSFDHLIGSSPVFMDVVKKAKKASMIESTLFLSGETGTGKEMFAQAIHQASDRREKPFVAINCAAIPQGLLESELSGYEPGAFTGAKSKGSPGKFELANGGTIFLDEIGDMPLDSQVHLLRILEERVVTRIGGVKTIPIDVRVIAATHKDLTEAVAKGEFREDLLYRLRVIQLKIPALRERAFDIPEMVNFFIREMCGQFGKRDVLIHADTMQYLSQYSWPGNIRELKNVIQQALFNMNGNILHPMDLPVELLEEIESASCTEKERFIEAMRREKGNVTNAAKMLGISRATMYRKIKQYHITDDHWIG
ncbi:sigma-54-dependent Fis family transcriptional regulator [Sporosarcina sp. ACRSM]|uniref:sigma-54-dependent Fis family transcriptional regulator n=1 Tax=Sporosarcina sp. ACRSM TaxID=2918216 RepID=UPI001EF6A307|nr:sigma-54-dependent Fis family transcriptional regulator [Sporosarcina sp. ACRSM]MCG7336234.1 sigma-54-dependent Fis family transcriptional regulator [Sporosarcina sp. ACRSM]